jgi:DNA invertase Pin-like site-specific DNA recombinase
LGIALAGGGPLFAEFERAMIPERTSAGLAAARAAGRIGGRRKKLDPAKRREMPGRSVAFLARTNETAFWYA